MYQYKYSKAKEKFLSCGFFFGLPCGVIGVNMCPQATNRELKMIEKSIDAEHGEHFDRELYVKVADSDDDFEEMLDCVERGSLYFIQCEGEVFRISSQDEVMMLAQAFMEMDENSAVTSCYVSAVTESGEEKVSLKVTISGVDEDG